MTFKFFYRSCFFSLLAVVVACSDADNETDLIDLQTIADQDIIKIQFPQTMETTVSINSNVKFTLQGLKSNGSDLVTLSGDIEWSVSADATSRINQQGVLAVAEVAESITVTAKFGILTESIDIRVSAAKFDRVVQLDDQSVDINMCQSQLLNPVGRYVEDNGDEEIRSVDSTVISDIVWTIVNEEDGSQSKRAYIEISNGQTRLHVLAAGDLIITAEALSVVTDNMQISDNFAQNVASNLNTIKLCNSSDENLSSCNLTEIDLETDTSLSVIAVANYQASDGSNFNENITRNSKWGISDADHASIVFSSSRQQMEVTADVDENADETLFAACGEIDQAIDSVDDFTQGIILDSEVSCGSHQNCLDTSVLIDIHPLTVESFEVTANDIDLTDNESITLSERPDEITLDVIANFSNSTSKNITEDTTEDLSLAYSILNIDDQDDAIEDQTDSPGVFTVLSEGTVKILLQYRGQSFTVVIEVP